MGHYMLLERKLIYTAITRAKKLVVLVGSKRALAMAIRNGPDLTLMEGERERKESESESEKGESRLYRAGRYTGLTTRLSQLA